VALVANLGNRIPRGAADATRTLARGIAGAVRDVGAGGPRRALQMLVGLVLYGVSIALMVRAGLGLAPWSVFEQGLSRTTGISLGWMIVIVSGPLLLIWIPLRQKPGAGTVANVLIIGPVVDLALAVLPPVPHLTVRIPLVVAGIILNALATALYIGTRLGPGPRDGLMTGFAQRLPHVSLRVIRTTIEVVVVVAGLLLGGVAGLGTIAYALAIGPLVQLLLPRLTMAPPRG
jgi:uncharacterized membrane protein YczE